MVSEKIIIILFILAILLSVFSIVITFNSNTESLKTSHNTDTGNVQLIVDRRAG